MSQVPQRQWGDEVLPGVYMLRGGTGPAAAAAASGLLEDDAANPSQKLQRLHEELSATHQQMAALLKSNEAIAAYLQSNAQGSDADEPAGSSSSEEEAEEGDADLGDDGGGGMDMASVSRAAARRPGRRSGKASHDPGLSEEAIRDFQDALSENEATLVVLRRRFEELSAALPSGRCHHAYREEVLGDGAPSGTSAPTSIAL